ncbi:spermatogenesis-associated protein 4 [Pungitius pungitius]|uniref:spermatogenesis-associated protein 4 n=1 Tax=Pungitius pungitius TaxID=134920 RepID=UPI002E11FCDD
MSSAGCPRRTGLPREVVKWLQSLELSLHPKNVRRDLSNGYLVAEILSRYYSRDFVVHSYDRGSSLAAKQGNWSQIEKSLRKLSLTLTKETVDGIIHCKPGAAELLVQEFYSILTHRSIGHVEAPQQLHSLRGLHEQPEGNGGPGAARRHLQGEEGLSRPAGTWSTSVFLYQQVAALSHQPSSVVRTEIH